MPYIKNDKGELEKVDGFISKITLLNGKTYALKCELIAARPITCKKCGGQLKLEYGEGKCEFCGTYYTTRFDIVEEEVS